ncbi:haloacid dehalogenase-like hydrolase family protein [Histomonas meleagridis]|uniref:haloacid dehalogenase-like hydrolase family protein n=1 Tax=Histomonas meleagridis TaxID=135588 RepID=UPI00355A5E96|nr:haloacid dehalogenase-like hydrolase family protein [Histomonas meleagridis]KAH0804001.1 haloacid dehalogenase-like hydrolase family protein [Histomonas meleagridis]
MVKAMTDIFGIDPPQNLSEYVGFKFAGVSDYTIVRSVVEKATGKTENNEDLINQMILLSEENYEKNYDGTTELLPGCEHLLKTLSENPNVTVAICSGNLPKIGESKLVAAGLWKYVNPGCCGWGLHEDRAEILRDTISRSREATKKSFDKVYHIGDAVQDVQAALDVNKTEEIDVIPIAVLTGRTREFPPNTRIVENLEKGFQELVDLITY